MMLPRRTATVMKSPTGSRSRKAASLLRAMPMAEATVATASVRTARALSAPVFRLQR